MNAHVDKVGLRASICILAVSVSFSTIVASSLAGEGATMQFRKVAETGMAAPGADPGVVFGALTRISHQVGELVALRAGRALCVRVRRAL